MIKVAEIEQYMLELKSVLERDRDRFTVTANPVHREQLLPLLNDYRIKNLHCTENVPPDCVYFFDNLQYEINQKEFLNEQRRNH